MVSVSVRVLCATVLALAFIASAHGVSVSAGRKLRHTLTRVRHTQSAQSQSQSQSQSSFARAAAQARTQAQALFSAVMARAGDGELSLMSWRERRHDLSPEHADVFNAETGEHNVSPAQLQAEREFFTRGVDTADIDTSSHRFQQLQSASMSLSTAQRAALAHQLEQQQTRARSAAALQQRVRAVDAAACLILKAELQRYYNAHAHVYPTAEEAWTQINTDNGGRATKPSQADIRALHPIVMYRIGYRGWAKACDATAIAIDATAQAIVNHAPTPVITDFMMGLEEELINTVLSPDPKDDVVTLAKSGNGIAPRLVPNLKVVPDHSTGAIIELATGPVPISRAGRTEHRNVVTLWDSKMNAWDNGRAADAQVTKSVDTVNGEFNAALTDAVGVGNVPTKYQLGATNTAKAWTIKRRVHPNPRKTYNNIQVNFEVSLCSYYITKRFAALTKDKDGELLNDAAYQTAVKWLNKGLPGITKAEIDALPPQQKCELGGLLTLYISQRMFFAIGARHKHYNTEYFKIPESDRPAYRPSHWGGSTTKNFFNVMIKTPLHTIIPYLPFPLSDVVHRFHEAFTALSADAQAAEWKQVHDWIIAKLNAGPDGWAKEYAGKISLEKKYFLFIWTSVIDDYWFPTDGSWLSKSLGAFQNHIALGQADPKVTNVAIPCLNPIPCGRAPRAEQWVNGDSTQMQVVLVAEARYQTDALNRAMNADANGDIDNQLAILSGATSYFKAGAGQAPPAPPAFA